MSGGTLSYYSMAYSPDIHAAIVDTHNKLDCSSSGLLVSDSTQYVNIVHLQEASHALVLR
jgi:hypothetical protein